MKMTQLEKRLVNRRRKGNRNVERVQMSLQKLGTDNLRDVLELGCGIGTVSAFLADTYRMQVWGTDLDPEQIRLARQKHAAHASLHFEIQDATALTFKPLRFDLVIAQNALHHMPDWQHGLSEIARVLRPGGYLLWFDLVCPEALKRLLRFLERKAGLYSLNDVSSALMTAGMVARLHERLRHGPFTHHHMVWQKSAA